MAVSLSRKPELFKFSSTQRSSSSDDPGNCYIDVGYGVIGAKGCILRCWSIPSTVYNVRSGKNVITYTFATSAGLIGTNTSITIPPGIYSATALATQMQTLLTGDGSSWTVTYSPVTMKFTFVLTDSAATSASFSFNFGGGLGNYPYKETGFYLSTRTATAGSGGTASLTSDIIPQLTYPEYLYLNITPFPARQEFKTGNNGLLISNPQFLFPMYQAQGSLIFNSFDVYKEQRLCFYGESNIVGRLHFQFTDYEGNVVSFNGADWCVDLEFVFTCPCLK